MTNIMGKKEIKNSGNMGKIPQHIAIIMDGNGRWAKNRNLPRVAGHRAGVEAVKRVVRACAELNIKVLTLYTFSVENWRRPKKEIDGLMWLIRRLLPKEIVEMNKNNVQFGAIGQLEAFPENVKKELNKAILMTKDNDGLKLRLALNYSARNEIVHAAKNISQNVKAGRYSIDEIDETLVSSHLFTAGLPDPNLLIRTSGEMRFSNFLLWQIVDAVLWVTPVFWPDFNEKHLTGAIEYWHRMQVT